METKLNEELSAVLGIHTEVKDKISKSSATVKTRVVDKLVETVLEERANKIEKGLALLKSLQNDLNKVKPDIQNFDEDGNPLQGVYSKEAATNKKNLKKQVSDLEVALNLALDDKNPNYDKLNNFIK